MRNGKWQCPEKWNPAQFIWLYPKSMQKWVTGLPRHCGTFSPLTVVLASLWQPAKTLAMLWPGVEVGIICSSLFLIHHSEISKILISQIRIRQVLRKLVVPGPFAPRIRFFFRLLYQPWNSFSFIALLYPSLIEQMITESTKAVYYTAGNLTVLTSMGCVCLVLNSPYQ